MHKNQAPTVFVALFLEPNQIGQFTEIGQTAISILEEDPHAEANLDLGADDIVLLDRDNIFLSLSWTKLNAGDVLTLAVGAVPDQVLDGDEALMAADTLRQLVERAEAMFKVTRSTWQASLMPLTLDTLGMHAGQFADGNASTNSQFGQFFITIEPDQTQNGAAPKNVRSVPETETEESNWTRQASALALSTAFTLVTPPVGIAMFTYAALRQGSGMDLLPRNLAALNTDFRAPLQA